MGEALFVLLENSQPEAGDSKIPSHTGVGAPGSTPAPIQDSEIEPGQMRNREAVGGGEYTWVARVIRAWGEAREFGMSLLRSS